MTRNRSVRKKASGRTASGKTASRQAYRHSAYWYARNYGYTRSDQTTYSARYLDFCGLLPEGGRNPVVERIAARNRSGRFPTLSSGLLTGYQPSNACCQFNPVLFSVYLMIDIGVAVRSAVETLADPKQRKKLTEKIKRDLRILRRPFYYARETERRRQLAAARRKIVRRTTAAPMPTIGELLEAWNRRKTSKVAMVRLGGMLQDLECYVDNSLRFNGRGEVIGRNSGIRGWIREFVPELFPKYKTLMRYKAMAIKVRQATGISDPTPTSAILPEEEPLEQPEKSQSTSDKEPTCERDFAHDQESACGKKCACDKEFVRGKETNAATSATGLEEMRIQCGNSQEGGSGSGGDNRGRREAEQYREVGVSKSACEKDRRREIDNENSVRKNEVARETGRLMDVAKAKIARGEDQWRKGVKSKSASGEVRWRDGVESESMRGENQCRKGVELESMRGENIWREVVNPKLVLAKRDLTRMMTEGRNSFEDLIRSLDKRIEAEMVLA